MNNVLKLHGEQLFLESTDPVFPLRNEDLLERFSDRKLTIVLHDPSYLSSRHEVSLKRRSEIKKMAEAMFQQTLAAQGVGSWAVIPRDKSPQLFVWGLDPSSAEWRRLNEIFALGFEIKLLSTDLIAVAPSIDAGSFDGMLRVVCLPQSVQIALMLAGQWVFARRVSRSAGESALEAIVSTLAHLEGKSYIHSRQALVWELSASEHDRDVLTSLWQGDEARMSAPQLIDPLTAQDKQIPAHGFNAMPRVAKLSSKRRYSTVSAAALALSAVLLVLCLPYTFLANTSTVGLKDEQIDEVPEALKRRYWQLTELQDQSIDTPSSVDSTSASILSVITRDPRLKLVELAKENGAAYSLRGQLVLASDNPLERQRLLAEVILQLGQRLPAYRSTVQVNRAYSIGDNNKTNSFELQLEVNLDVDSAL